MKDGDRETERQKERKSETERCMAAAGYRMLMVEPTLPTASGPLALWHRAPDLSAPATEYQSSVPKQQHMNTTTTKIKK